MEDLHGRKIIIEETERSIQTNWFIYQQWSVHP